MSNYTTQLRYICETYAGLTESAGYNSVDDVIAKSWDKIFNFDFPLWDDSYRQTLCSKIIAHYYMQEIAFETVGRWQLALQVKINEIMPYYNDLYTSIQMLADKPLDNKNYQRTVNITGNTQNSGTTNRTTEGTTDRTTTGSSEAITSNTATTIDSGSSNSTRTDNLANSQTVNGTVTGTGSDTGYTSDTPQGTLTDVLAGKYMTNANVSNTNSNSTTAQTTTGTNTGTVTDSGETSGNSKTTTAGTDNTTTSGTDNTTTSGTDNTTSNGTEDRTEQHTETVTGYDGGATVTERVEAYRKALINIDLMVIEALDGLFMQIW